MLSVILPKGTVRAREVLEFTSGHQNVNGGLYLGLEPWPLSRGPS